MMKKRQYIAPAIMAVNYADEQGLCAASITSVSGDAGILLGKDAPIVPEEGDAKAHGGGFWDDED